MPPRDWRTFGALHRRLYEWFGGHGVGSVGGGRKVLLLTTTGRKTGKLRTTPLVYQACDDFFVVYPSNGGQERPPAWWLNLQRTPEASVQIGRQRLSVVASAAADDEYAKLWPAARDYNPHWKSYEETTKRDIPLVILRPISK